MYYRPSFDTFCVRPICSIFYTAYYEMQQENLKYIILTVTLT